ncbi:family 78 glycoside hydrolase catalytic domain [Polaribacter haliotis]|uniref:Family 78 glycoside hydrolase catalytic domain n=1 Tax=Polaribacter haliotis TaxID=1888915 RepID=A0A7L8AFC8_9FLAO|nr:trehalase family glycosidase [Polaribacter haliotis]QOD60715.1 family 78 glycoside hydrolase catalytic domain [Polaribacter haliotis]
MMKICKYLAILVGLIFASCAGGKKEVKVEETLAEKMMHIEGMINVEAGKPNNFTFTDLGAWHGYGITKKEIENKEISFRGPIFLVNGGYFYENKNQSGLVKLSVVAKEVPLKFERKKATHTPGILQQVFQNEKLKISQRLIYISSDKSLTETIIENVGDQKNTLNLKWNMVPYTVDKEVFKTKGKTLIMNTNPHGAYGLEFNNDKIKLNITENGTGKAVLNNVDLKPNEKKTFYFVETFLADEKIDSERFLNQLETSPVKEGKSEIELFAENRKRWLNYFNEITKPNTKWLKDENNQRIAAKSLQTLITNWRTPAGNLEGEGIYPCLGYFNGYWAWDSWKHAAALVDIAPDLAKKQIEGMFMFQNEAGMVGDVVRYYKRDDNWRDSKPPLAGWAVWLAYEATNDKDFLEKIYPKLVKYHNWWYKERDANKNGLCEYGSTDGTHQAAAWESGMDNAARFDDAKVVKQTYGGTYNQESVDLNTYLWQEKGFLSKMAKALGKQQDAANFSKEANELKDKINDRFWDEKDGYFYDWSLSNKKMIKIVGSEGWTPLFANLASEDQAKRVKDVMLNPEMFNTYVPLGTLAVNDSKYEKDGYWKGSIWVDQIYFGVKALRNYGYNKEADELQERTLKNLEGISEPGVPIRENYDPLSGIGYRGVQFSWSAGHLLMLLMNK